MVSIDIQPTTWLLGQQAVLIEPPGSRDHRLEGCPTTQLQGSQVRAIEPPGSLTAGHELTIDGTKIRETEPHGGGRKPNKLVNTSSRYNAEQLMVSMMCVMPIAIKHTKVAYRNC